MTQLSQFSVAQELQRFKKTQQQLAGNMLLPKPRTDTLEEIQTLMWY